MNWPEPGGFPEMVIAVVAKGRDLVGPVRFGPVVCAPAGSVMATRPHERGAGAAAGGFSQTSPAKG